MHTYLGGFLGLSKDYSASGTVGIFCAWAVNEKDQRSSDEYVGNGFNWTGYFWGLSFSAGVGSIGGNIAAFTARDPLEEHFEGNYWRGFEIAWNPSFGSKAGATKKVGEVLDLLKNKTKGMSVNQTYYWMIYGNGSDYLPKKNVDVSGWNILNPIDPKDDN